MKTDLGTLLGNEAIKAVLRDGAPSQTFLIEGARGSGRHTLANILAGAALCRSAEGPVPCGRCGQCRKFASGSHVDVTAIPSDVKAEELRRILSDVSVYPNEGAKKVYIIDEADKLGTVAQNILLKTLEEPPAFAVFLLICRTKESLLETVRSRCLILSLMPVADGELLPWLKRKYPSLAPETLKDALHRAKGCPGIACEACENADTETDALVRSVTEAIAHGDTVTVASLFAAQKDRESFRRLVTGVREALSASLIARETGRGTASVPLDGKTLSKLVYAFRDLEEKTALNVNLSLWSTVIADRCRESTKQKPSASDGGNRRRT